MLDSPDRLEREVQSLRYIAKDVCESRTLEHGVLPGRGAFIESETGGQASFEREAIFAKQQRRGWKYLYRPLKGGSDLRVQQMKPSALSTATTRPKSRFRARPFGSEVARRRRTHLSPAVLGALMVAALVATNAPPAEAYPRAVGCGSATDDSVTYTFVGTWSGSQKDAFRDGVAQWENPNELNGDVVSFNEEIFGGDFDVTIEPLGGASGSTGCSASSTGGDIRLDSSLTLSEIEKTGMHEAGHALGLKHTGYRDSHDGPKVPAMATCLSASNAAARNVIQDDAGSLTRLHSFSTAETMHANAGFERGELYWGKSSVSDFYDTTTGTLDGSRNLRFRPTADYGYIYQTMNYVDAAGEDIDARTNIKKIVTWTSTGQIRMRLLTRVVTYAAASGCSVGQYVTGLNQNSRTHGALTIVRTETSTPTSSWKTVTEPTLYASGGHGNRDVRIRVESNVKYSSTGGYATIAVDTTRARDRD